MNVCCYCHAPIAQYIKLLPQLTLIRLVNVTKLVTREHTLIV
jgi:hypothetical protein